MKIFQKLVSISSIIFLSLGSLFTLVGAQANKEIIVNVRDEEDEGVEGINITLIGPGSYTNTIVTSDNGGAIFDDIEDNGEYTATISFPSSSDWKIKSGESTSKSAEISNSNDSETITFEVVEKTAPVEETTPKILETDLPAIFTKVGSTTTILKNIKKADVAAVKNFTLDDPAANKIVFLQELDLSDDALAEKFAELDQYVSISEKGRISVDTEELSVLNKKAQVTMRGLKLVGGTTPLIVADGQASSKVSNAKYVGQLLTFDVAGFSNYAFRPTLKIEADDETSQSSFTLNGEVDDLESKIDIYLGEERIAQEIEPEDDGAFVFTYNLENEENEFKVIASSENGEVAEVAFDVTYAGGVHVEEPQGLPFIAVLGIVALLAALIALIYYFIRKNRKKKLAQTSKAEQILDADNPPMPEMEKEDLMENKVVEEVDTNKIGQTDLDPIDSHE